MDITPQDHKEAGALLSIAIFHAIMGWITLANAQAVLSMGATAISVICGILAGRYYWHQGNVAKRKSQEEED